MLTWTIELVNWYFLWTRKLNVETTHKRNFIHFIICKSHFYCERYLLWHPSMNSTRNNKKQTWNIDIYLLWIYNCVCVRVCIVNIVRKTIINNQPHVTCHVMFMLCQLYEFVIPFYSCQLFRMFHATPTIYHYYYFYFSSIFAIARLTSCCINFAEFVWLHVVAVDNSSPNSFGPHIYWI